MGGKTWSKAEELCFWNVIIPQSPKAVKRADRVNDWEDCTRIMHRRMGDAARRKYTKLMLFEHYFQNVQTGHRSPRAHEFVTEHKRQLEAENAKNREVLLTSSTFTTDPAIAVEPRTVASSISESQPDFFTFPTPGFAAYRLEDDAGTGAAAAAPYASMHAGVSHADEPAVLSAADSQVEFIFPYPASAHGEEVQVHHGASGGHGFVSSANEAGVLNHDDYDPEADSLSSNWASASSSVSPSISSDALPIQGSGIATNDAATVGGINDHSGKSSQTTDCADESNIGAEMTKHVV